MTHDEAMAVIVRWAGIPLVLFNQLCYGLTTLATGYCTGTGRATPSIQGRFICAEGHLAAAIVVFDCIVINVLALIIWLFAHRLRYTSLIRFLLLVYLFGFRLFLINWMHDTYVIPPPQ